jgi:hypothetical protein
VECEWGRKMKEEWLIGEGGEERERRGEGEEVTLNVLIFSRSMLYQCSGTSGSNPFSFANEIRNAFLLCAFAQYFAEHKNLVIVENK